MGRRKLGEVTYKEAARALGKSPSYFAVMRKLNPEWFAYLQSYGGRSLVEQYHKYQAESAKLKQKACDLYYADVSKLYDKLCETGVAANRHKAYSFTHRSIFTSNEGFNRFDVFMKWKKALI